MGLPGGLPSPPGGGSSSSSSSSSSSGGSSGGGSSPDVYGDSNAEQRAIKSALATYTNMLLGWGIPVTRQMRNLITRLAKEGASSAQLLQAIRRTKDYAAVFPGIMRRDGTLRMSESQYVAAYQSAKDFAASTGRGLSKGAYGMALKNGNSPSEVKAKIQALDILKENKEVMNEFGQYLVATGQAKKPPTKEELLKFVMKQGPKNWEETWQTAYTASQIEKYGGLGDFNVGKGEDLGYKGLQKLIKQAPPGTDPTQIDWREMARVAADTLPASKLYEMGITKTDLIKMQLGTPDAVNIERRAKLAKATYAARFEDKATPQLHPGGGENIRSAPDAQATE